MGLVHLIGCIRMYMNRMQTTLTQLFEMKGEEDDDDVNRDEYEDLNSHELSEAIQSLTQDIEGDDEINDDDESVILIGTHNYANVTEPQLKRIKSMDSSTIRYFNSIDGVRRVFKCGESFTSKTTYNKCTKDLSRFIYKICSFYDKELKAYAVCEKYMKRTDTNLMLFVNDDKFQKYAGMEYVMFSNKVNMLVSDLDVQVPTPESILIFDAKKKLSASHGFDISYKLTKSLTNKYTPTYNRPTVLDLFAGCGGMSQGFINAGFDVKWAVEIMNDAVSSFEKNHRDCEVFPEDIRIFEERLAGKDKAYEHIRPNHIHFSPPCQGFSTLNRNEDPKNFDKNKLTLTALKIVEHLMPDTVSMENVTGMLDDIKGCRYFLREVVSTLVVLGYSTRIQILSCERYGDATVRKRVIVTAARSPLLIPRYPKETHFSHHSSRLQQNYSDNLKPAVTPGVSK